VNVHGERPVERRRTDSGEGDVVLRPIISDAPTLERRSVGERRTRESNDGAGEARGGGDGERDLHLDCEKERRKREEGEEGEERRKGEENQHCE
jgi:hypothetical protein